MEWQRNQVLPDTPKKSKTVSEPTVAMVTIPDAPSVQSASKPKELSIRDLNVRLSNVLLFFLSKNSSFSRYAL